MFTIFLQFIICIYIYCLVSNIPKKNILNMFVHTLGCRKIHKYSTYIYFIYLPQYTCIN